MGRREGTEEEQEQEQEQVQVQVHIASVQTRARSSEKSVTPPRAHTAVCVCPRSIMNCCCPPQSSRR